MKNTRQQSQSEYMTWEHAKVIGRKQDWYGRGVRETLL